MCDQSCVTCLGQCWLSGHIIWADHSRCICHDNMHEMTTWSATLKHTVARLYIACMLCFTELTLSWCVVTVVSALSDQQYQQDQHHINGNWAMDQSVPCALGPPCGSVSWFSCGLEPVWYAFSCYQCLSVPRNARQNWCNIFIKERSVMITLHSG